MKIRNLLLLGICFLTTGLHAQISISPTVLNFFTVFQSVPDSLTLTVTNTKTAGVLKVTDINFAHTETYSISDTAFSLNPGQSKVVTVYCDPYHNVRYPDWLTIETSTEPIALSAFMYAQGKYLDTYYDATLNKWDEDLETALKTTIGFGYQALGYNGARDAIFMQLDNQAWNGQGASQNTLECIYTGVQAVGYTSRTDCQNNYNFNTEHTIPQSLFSQNPPMVSDMHHLFATTESANTERGNNPFGVVASPTWSAGGSKSNGVVFEPRDAHKGRGARAVLYFALRYQDYSGFIANQQNLMRLWHTNFPPDPVEKTRNNNIYALQNNRNPFIDHPEFLERITLLVGTGNRPSVPQVFLGADSLHYSAPFPGYQDGYFVLANTGRDTLHFSNVTFSHADFSLVGSPNTAIPPDSARKVWVRLTPSGVVGTYDETVTVQTDDAAQPSVVVHLMGESISTGVAEKVTDRPVLYPQPAQDKVTLEWASPAVEGGQIQVQTLQGQLIRQYQVPAGSRSFGMELAHVPAGCYLIRIERDGDAHVQKLILE